MAILPKKKGYNTITPRDSYYTTVYNYFTVILVFIDIHIEISLIAFRDWSKRKFSDQLPELVIYWIAESINLH